MVDGLDLVGDPAALAAHPSAADVEDLHGGFQLVLGDRDQVGVGRVGEHDRALLHGLLAGPRCRRAGGRPARTPSPRPHRVICRLQPADVRPGAAGHEVAEVLGQFAVLLGGDPPDAGGRALADVAEQAGAAGARGVLEHAGGAGADGEDPQQQVDGLADRPRVPVRTEVAHALGFLAAHDLHARELLVQRDREVRVALVVAVLDVEPGVELLDPGVLQLERLDLGGHHRPLHGGGRGDHRARCAGGGRPGPGSSWPGAGAGSSPSRRRSPGGARRGICRPPASRGSVPAWGGSWRGRPCLTPYWRGVTARRACG